MPAHMDVNRADLKDACLVMLQKHAEALAPKPVPAGSGRFARIPPPTVEAP